MKQVTKLFGCILCAALIGCASGSLRPSIFTLPESYLTSFPLNEMTEEALILQIGPPERYAQIGEKRAMVYEVGEGYGLRTYTYLLEDGRVVDVVYNDNSSWNGKTARVAQGR